MGVSALGQGRNTTDPTCGHRSRRRSAGFQACCIAGFQTCGVAAWHCRL